MCGGVVRSLLLTSRQLVLIRVFVQIKLPTCRLPWVIEVWMTVHVFGSRWSCAEVVLLTPWSAVPELSKPKVATIGLLRLAVGKLREEVSRWYADSSCPDSIPDISACCRSVDQGAANTSFTILATSALSTGLPSK